MNAALEANEVASYLKSHPEFFDQYAELLAQVHIPDPHGGRAISITERQLGSLRDRNKQLEAKLAELIRFGEENDAISEKIHRMTVALIAATDYPVVVRTLYSHLGGAFAIPQVIAGPFTARLQLRSGGFTLYGTAAGEVTPGPAPTLVDVRVQDSGTVTGRVFRADGVTPARGAEIRLRVRNEQHDVVCPSRIFIIVEHASH